MSDSIDLHAYLQSQAEEDHVVKSISDWSLTHGLAVRPSPAVVETIHDIQRSLAITAPVTLFPSSFPRKCFEEALGIQRAYNELYARIASDEKWLSEVMKQLVDVDDFLAQLWKIHLQVRNSGIPLQDLNLGLFRSDYMVNVENESTLIKQVEFNTIASSFGGLSSRVSELHRYMLISGNYPQKISDKIVIDALPVNESDKKLAAGLASAHSAYGSGYTHLVKCILFIVQDPENNIFDQRHLEYNLLTRHKTRTFRISLSSVLTNTVLQEHSLVYIPPHCATTKYEVSVIYFRAGYSPTDYSSSLHWQARLHLEQSLAIKCPSILTHLAGSKKVQQILASPSFDLSHFLPDSNDMLFRIQQTFTTILPFDSSPEGLQARSIALDPEKCINYVLKPQREGGGNNIYSSRIPDFLKSIPERQWSAYILMEMIRPPKDMYNAISRNGKVEKGKVISELGVYGVVLWKSQIDSQTRKVIGVKEWIENGDAGWLLRTKGEKSEEGGVAAGFGAVDSIHLVD